MSEGDRFCPGCGTKIGEHGRSPDIRDSKPKFTMPKFSDEQIGCAIIIVILAIIFGCNEYNDFKMKKKISERYRNNINQWQR